MMIIKIKPEGGENLANDGDSKYKMEIADLINKAIELCQKQGGETKMVIEHLQMALKELEDGKMQKDDSYADEMMKSKDSGSFGEMMMKKSEEESNS